jgi:hypothetical protein
MKNLLKLNVFGMLFICFSTITFAQKQLAKKASNTLNTGKAIDWSEPVIEVKYDGSSKAYLFFEGAVYLDDTSLPHLIENIAVSSYNSIKPKLTDARFTPLSSLERTAISGIEVATSIDPVVTLYTERKQTYARISFIPLRRNPTTGQVEKLVSYNLEKRQIVNGSAKAAAPSQFASSSVLASGSWFKFGIAQDGMFRLTYNDLQEMGMDVASIDPRRLNVYGNGGGMLPQANSSFRHDDLVQTAIQVVGEADGSFDQGDYVVFYGKGPHKWVEDTTSCGNFRHVFNVYSDLAYYFITVDRGNGRRVASVASSGASASHTVNKFDDHQFHESDNSNLLKSGREWFGEEFDLQLSHSIDFGFSNVASDPGYLSTRLLAKSTVGTSFSVRVNGSTVENVNVPSAPGGYNKNAEDEFTCSQFQFASGNTNVAFNYSKGGNPSAVGWLDYLEIVLKRNLSMAGGQMGFRDRSSVGFGNIADFQIGSSNSALQVWEVTDPTNASKRDLALNSSTSSFKIEADSLRQFVAFNGSSYLSPDLIGSVSNQNLHGLPQADMLIVCHPDFWSEAERLAEFHRTNETSPLSVHIVSPAQIFNEFSSGAQDVSSIRDFMRMFYERSTNPNDLPRYLLLFGDASYDYKDRLPGNTNFVPTYESVESLTPTISYASDDYFGLLDPDEGAWASSASDALDIGIGRFVVRTLEDARVVVDKIYRYEELATSAIIDPSHICEDGGAEASLSPDWRNRIVFVADDEDSNMHLNQSDQLANLVDTMYPEYNLTKIYFDSFVQESTPGGQRYPEVSINLNTEVQRGALIVNYTGHGGELGWAHERVLGVSDINGWNNYNSLPVFVTATCEFTRYDDPSRISAGELVHLNPNGGGIALFTTSRLVYSAPNFTLNKNFYLNLLVEQPWGPPTMGDVIRMTKVASGGSVNNRNFSLIGDPAQRLAFPLHDVQTLTINGEDINSLTDTINALELVTVTGTMKNRNGQAMPDFNGVVYPTVFDKTTEVSTLANDPSSSVQQFSVQKNLIYKGKASVTNGDFSFSFVVPRDIAYNYDVGRISYYAEGSGTNANGHFEDFVIGGSNENGATDENGPTIGLYMNDESFAYGGTTDEAPSLLAVVLDSNGINTVGNGIGHDITAVLDDNTNATLNLNDFYQSDLDSYQSGRVVYPFSDLSEGTHNLRLKVWDVYNNSSEAYTEFVVAESAQLALEHVLNYPNPFTTRTSFMFEHNQPCNSLDVQVQVFTVSGKLVKTINETVLSHGFRNEPIEWNGLDDYGQKIGRGVYMYNLKITTPDGQKAEQIERLVILN